MNADVSATNLLPRERIRMYRMQYFLRLATVAILLACFLLLMHAALLLPTYVFESSQARVRAYRLSTLEANLNTPDQSALESRLAVLSNNAAFLTQLPHATYASPLLAQVLAIPRPGITLSHFSFTPEGQSGTFVVSGVADTRNDLRSFQLALQTSPIVSSADLPVSAYAQASAIPFTITITLAP